MKHHLNGRSIFVAALNSASGKEPLIHMPAFFYTLLVLLLSCAGEILAEPVVIRGARFADLVGTPLDRIRLCDGHGRPIPFQIDELTAQGEYVCDRGEDANGDSGNGLLDREDEIVFLREDCRPCGESAELWKKRRESGCTVQKILIRDGGEGGECRAAWICNDTTAGLSNVHYINYDHGSQSVKTPWYFARFGRDRFHFVTAGISTGKDGGWVDLTRELRIEISMRALWGLLPISFTEDNLICFVKRYKTGPIRLIRRGDFHLRLGLGIKGSRAAVNQICYPQMVSVPVNVHIPVRFRSFFREAWLEMTPEVSKKGANYSFSLSGKGFSERLGDTSAIDTLVSSRLNRNLFTITDQRSAVGWVLLTDLPETDGIGSGFVLRRPSERDAIAECGYRLMIHDVPKGRYDITNWVFFSQDGLKSIDRDFRGITAPAIVETGERTSPNLLPASVTR